MVLAGVLLHMIEPPGPVNDAGDGFPNFHGLFTIVENDPVFFVDVGDGHTAKRSPVRGLSAALGVKGGAVQHHNKPVFAGFAG